MSFSKNPKKAAAGTITLLTGHGREKTFCAIGMATQALACGMSAGIVQFSRHAEDSNLESFFRGHPRVIWHTTEISFYCYPQRDTGQRKAAADSWLVASQMMRDKAIDSVLLDDLTHALKYNLLIPDLVVSDITTRAPGQNIVITGRDATDYLFEIADTVTHFDCKKKRTE